MHPFFVSLSPRSLSLGYRLLSNRLPSPCPTTMNLPPSDLAIFIPSEPTCLQCLEEAAQKQHDNDGQSPLSTTSVSSTPRGFLCSKCDIFSRCWVTFKNHSSLLWLVGILSIFLMVALLTLTTLAMLQPPGQPTPPSISLCYFPLVNVTLYLEQGHQSSYLRFEGPPAPISIHGLYTSSSL